MPAQFGGPKFLRYLLLEVSNRSEKRSRRLLRHHSGKLVGTLIAGDPSVSFDPLDLSCSAFQVEVPHNVPDGSCRSLAWPRPGVPALAMALAGSECTTTCGNRLPGTT
jgi:hypothetical protein